MRKSSSLPKRDRKEKKFRFRQYGLWERYIDLYPKNDLIYTVGVSNYAKDWFLAHVNRKVGNTAYKATTWQIIFELKSVMQSGSYTLQIALASTTNSELQVRFNNANAKRPLFTTRLIGKDNAIARYGIHGLYWFYSIQPFYNYDIITLAKVDKGGHNTGRVNSHALGLKPCHLSDVLGV
ncbi:uncharacterized protein LOC122723260 [Manihot esculenta]|uniref:uncharacterized protein LOC122723260 n=1 Tax=Manihot esculenta TaxID=3983 RepID=UPI001CC774FC|nr:uncharacterized protein LOC122723260 [Manihot esculenta]